MKSEDTNFEEDGYNFAIEVIPMKQMQEVMGWSLFMGGGRWFAVIAMH